MFRPTQSADERRRGSQVSSLEKKYSKQVRAILEEQHLKEAERMQIPSKLKNLQADCAAWRTKEEEWKKGRIEEFQTQLNEISHPSFCGGGGEREVLDGTGKTVEGLPEDL